MAEPCVGYHNFERLRSRGNNETESISETEIKPKNGSRKHTSFLTKFKPELNSWEDVT